MSSTTLTSTECSRQRIRPATAPAHRDGEQHEHSRVVAWLLARDDRAIAELFTTYGGRILGMALHVLHDRQLAEEAVQETLLRVWRKSDTFDPARELEPWLFRIARNTAYDMARSRSRRPTAQRGDSTRVLGDLAETDPSHDPAAASAALALRWEVRSAIDALPAVERDVVRLQHLGGLSHREIAERLGISPGTVKSRSHRAHRRLAEALGTAQSTADRVA